MNSLVAPFDAYKGDEPYIFVSYAHLNSDIVFAHIQKLRDAGFRIWYDEGIDPGTDWSDEIALALNNAASFLVFMSPEAANSHNVKKEIVFAVSKKKHMVCVYIAETELPLGLEMQLGNIQGIPETRFINKDKFYERFMNALPQNTKGAAENNSTEKPEPTPPKAVSDTPIRQGDFEISGTVLTRYFGSARILTLPNHITVVGPQAFADCRSLQSVILPDGVSKIEVTAFVNCVNLQFLFLPKTVTNVAYGAFTNCNKLTVKCWRDTPSYFAVKKVWSGPIVFLDDAPRAPITANKPPQEAPAPPITVSAPEKANTGSTEKSQSGRKTGDGQGTELPENTVAFVPKGTATITLRDGTEHTAIANTLLFLSSFEGHIGAYLYQGLDEEPQKKGYKRENMIYFEDMEEFQVDLAADKTSGTLLITDYEGEQQTKKLLDLSEELWFIRPEKPTDMTVIPVIDIARVVLNFKNRPSCVLPMALIELNELNHLLVPQAFIQFCRRDSSKVIPREYWSTEIPLEENGNLLIKRIKTMEITKVIRKTAMYQMYTEVELIIEKRNGERFEDKINSIISLHVLTRAGLTSLNLATISKITCNFTTI